MADNPEEMPPIPSFLLAKNRPAPAPDAESEPAAPGWVMPVAPRRPGPTRAQKDSAAQAVAAAVRRGADTLGKIRKAMPDEPEVTLRAGLRLSIRLKLVARTGKRYRSR